MTKKFHTLLLLVALLAPAVHAQAPISVTPLGGIPLPWGLANLSVVDSTLYACQNGVLVSSPSLGQAITSLKPDTTVSRLCPGATYVVRNRRDSLLYYSALPDHQEPYSFNVRTNARFFKNHHVEVRAWFRDICHPAFSADGNHMVFSSQGRVGLGGYDLWYTYWNGKRWAKPINLGNTINTPGNEVSPVFYGKFLIFASDGVPSAPQGYNLYAVRIRPGAKPDDIIFDNYVVQPLPQPLNSDGDDREMAFDTLAGRGYWVSTRNGREQLFTFSGSLEGVNLSGRVVDDHSLPVPGARVRLFSEGRLVALATTDSAGRYSLFAHPDDDYHLQVDKQDYFNVRETLALIRPNEDLLIANQTVDITLSQLPFGRVLVFDNLFAENTDIELSPSARQALQPVADYLRDNTNVLAQFTIHCSDTSDPSYQEMIISRRINNIQLFLESVLPPEASISYKSGLRTPTESPLSMPSNAVYVELFHKH